MSETTHTPVLLLSGDVARIWEVTPTTVRLTARFGGLPVAAITPGGTRLFAPNDVLRLKAERERAKRGAAL